MDFVRPPQGAVYAILALRRIGEPVAMPAQEVCPRAIQFRDPPSACDPIQKTRTYEIWAISAELAGHPDHRRRLLDIPPFVPLAAYAIGKNEPLCLGPKADIGHAPAIAGPLPAANITIYSPPFPLQIGQREKPAGGTMARTGIRARANAAANGRTETCWHLEFVMAVRPVVRTQPQFPRRGPPANQCGRVPGAVTR